MSFTEVVKIVTSENPSDEDLSKVVHYHTKIGSLVYDYENYEDFVNSWEDDHLIDTWGESVGYSEKDDYYEDHEEREKAILEIYFFVPKYYKMFGDLYSRLADIGGKEYIMKTWDGRNIGFFEQDLRKLDYYAKALGDQNLIDEFFCSVDDNDKNMGFYNPENFRWIVSMLSIDAAMEFMNQN